VLPTAPFSKFQLESWFLTGFIARELTAPAEGAKRDIIKITKKIRIIRLVFITPRSLHSHSWLLR
jgi:hypothetical protein